MEKYCFITDKYTVTVREGGEVRTVPVYVALVCDGDGNNKPLPPDVAAEFDGLDMGTNTVKTYFAPFDFHEEAEVTVDLRDGAERVVLKPQELPFVPRSGGEGNGETALYSFDGARLTFATREDCRLVIQPDGDIFGGLHLFGTRRRPMTRDRAHVIEFASGVHTVENSPHIRADEHGNPMVVGIESDTLIYLHEGTVVCAAIELRGVERVRIAGTGVLSTVHRCHGAADGFAADRMWGAFRDHAAPSILIRSGCRDVVVEDVTLNSEFRCVVIRNSSGITLRGVKMFSSTENADGINCYNTCDLLVENCYVDSCDDCFCMYNGCDSIPFLFDEGYHDVTAVCRNVEVRNCVLCSASRPIVLGGHATGATSPRCLIENIRIHDCDIIETPKRIFGCPREREMRWSGHLRVLSQSEQLVRNIEFSDIRIHSTKGCISKPVHIEVRDNANASYTESGGYRIENITFRNIQFGGHTEDCLPIVICSRPSRGEGDDCGIYGVRFDNFTVSGTPVRRDDMVLDGPVEVGS